MAQSHKSDLSIVKVAEDDDAKIVRSRMGIKVKEFLASLGVLQDTSGANGEERFVWPKHTMREIKDYSELVYQYPPHESPWSVRFKALGCYNKISPFENNPSGEPRKSLTAQKNVPPSKDDTHQHSSDQHEQNTRKSKENVKENIGNGMYNSLFADLELTDSDESNNGSSPTTAYSADEHHKNLSKVTNKKKEEDRSSRKLTTNNNVTNQASFKTDNRADRLQKMLQITDQDKRKAEEVNRILEKTVALLNSNKKENSLISPLGDRFRGSDSEGNEHTSHPSIESQLSLSDQELIQAQPPPRAKKIPSKTRKRSEKRSSRYSYVLASKITPENLNDSFYEELTHKTNPAHFNSFLKEPFVQKAKTSGIILLPDDIKLPDELAKFEATIETIREHESTLPLEEAPQTDGEVLDEDEPDQEKEQKVNSDMEIEHETEPFNVFPSNGQAPDRQAPIPRKDLRVPTPQKNSPRSPLKRDEQPPFVAPPPVTCTTIGINTSPRLYAPRPDREIEVQVTTEPPAPPTPVPLPPAKESPEKAKPKCEQLHAILLEIDKQAEECEIALRKSTSSQKEQSLFEESKSQASSLWSNLGAYISATSSDFSSPLQNGHTMHTGHPSCEPNFTTYPVVMLTAARHLLASAYLDESSTETTPAALETYGRLNDLIDTIEKRVAKAESKINKRIKRFHSLLTRNGSEVDEKRIIGMNWATMWTYLMARLKSMILFREYSLRQKNIGDIISMNELDVSLKQARDPQQPVNNGIQSKSDESQSSNSSFLTFLSEPFKSSSQSDKPDIGRNLLRDESAFKNCFNLLKLYHILHRAFTKWQEADTLSKSCLSTFVSSHLQPLDRIIPQSFDYQISRVGNHLSLPIASTNIRIGQIFLYFDSVIKFHEFTIDHLKQSLIRMNIFSIPKVILQEVKGSLDQNQNPKGREAGSKLSRSKSLPKTNHQLPVQHQVQPQTIISSVMNGSAFSTENTDDDSLSNLQYTPTTTANRKKEKSLKRPNEHKDPNPLPVKVNGYVPSSYTPEQTQPAVNGRSEKAPSSKSIGKRSKSEVHMFSNNNSNQKTSAPNNFSRKSNLESKDRYSKNPSSSSLNKVKPSLKTNSSKTPNVSHYESSGRFSSSNSNKNRLSKPAVSESDNELAPSPAGGLTYTPTPLIELPASLSNGKSSKSLSHMKAGSKTPRTSYGEPLSNHYSPQNVVEVSATNPSATKRKKANDSYEPSPIVNTKPPATTYNPTGSNSIYSAGGTKSSSVQNNLTNQSKNATKHVYNPTPSAAPASGKNSLANSNGKVPQFFNNWLNTTANNRR